MGKVGKDTEVQRGLSSFVKVMERALRPEWGPEPRAWVGLLLQEVSRGLLFRRFGTCTAQGCYWPPALSQVQWVKPGAPGLSGP